MFFIAFAVIGIVAYTFALAYSIFQQLFLAELEENEKEEYSDYAATRGLETWE